MDYIGEHGWVADLGQVLVAMATVFGVVALASFYLENRVLDIHKASWKRLGRTAIIIQTVSFLGVMALVFTMLANRYYEYEYVYKHASNEMPFKYVLVAFWGGQQGSLLLWGGWQSIMTLGLLFGLKYEKTRVLGFMALVNTFIAAMLLGVHIGDFKLGVSPFLLLREVDDNMGPLWEQIPNYLSLDPAFEDGTGLTPSLQNYWMLIHPPTLFLGFSLLLIPAALASAGWAAGDRKGWVKPALPWAFAGVGILGIGILMGGAWAYESLNFGGFWAWDPVENASLIPWIFLVAGAHVMLITRNTGKAGFSSAFLVIVAYLLVIYASFLTRSGVLSDTSVHSFTGDGMAEELLVMLVTVGCYATWPLLGKGLSTLVMAGAGIVAVLFITFNGYILDKDWIGDSFVGWFMLAYLLITFGAVIIGYLKSMKGEGEEEVTSREFWMFVGAVVLILSAIFLIYTTSLPALNEAFGIKKILYPQDGRNGFYNLYMGVFAVIIICLVGFSQYLRYKKTPARYFWKQLIVPLVIAIVLTWVVDFYHDIAGQETALLFILTFASVFAIAANLDYWFRVLRGHVSGVGASVAHVGFAILMLGAVISMGKQQVITRNQTEFVMAYLNDKEDVNNFSDVEDMQVYLHDTLEMGPSYYVAYTGEEFVEPYFLYYNIEYFDKEAKSYRKGDTIAAGYMLYEAEVDHEATDFVEDYEKGLWKQLDVFDGKEYYSYPFWRATKPGKKLFENRPRILLDVKDFKNHFPEPGTKHYWDYDVFTHIRQANLLPMKVKALQRGDTTPMIMAPNEYEVSMAEPVFPTLSYNIRILDFRAMNAQEREDNALSSMDQGFALDLAIFAYRDQEFRQPYLTSIYHVNRGDAVDAVPRYLPELHMHLTFDDWDFELDTTDLVLPEAKSNEFPEMTFEEHEKVMGDLDSLEMAQEMMDQQLITTDSSTNSTGIDKQKLNFKITVGEDEYIIMKGTVFPWINLIWIGSLMMFLGTILAVYLRWRRR